MLQREAGCVLNKHNMMAPGEFFGATRVQFRSGDLTVSAVTHAQPRVIPKHAHAHVFFSMVVTGQYREWFGPSHWDARPLAMVLRPSQIEHLDEIGPEGVLLLCVDIAPPYWNSLADAGTRLQRHAFDARPMSGVALRLLRELCEKRDGWRGVAESLVSELVTEYVTDFRRVQRREPRWLRRAIERLNEDSGESLTGIAAELDLHPVHVSRMFKRHLGVTVSQYLRELRLQRTTRALLEGRKSLAALADDHGFADQSHMTREFSHATGWSPARLRCECERLHN